MEDLVRASIGQGEDDGTARNCRRSDPFVNLKRSWSNDYALKC